MGSWMLKQADNERVTRSGPNTPLGRLMRAYWQPAALVSEMPADRPVRAVRLLGEDLPPPFPDYDCFTAPDAYTFAFKGLWECNWLQGVEGGIDPSHVSFLHRFVGEDPREVYGQQFSEVVEGTDKKLSELVAENYRPDIEVEEAAHGLRVSAVRRPP